MSTTKSVIEYKKTLKCIREVLSGLKPSASYTEQQYVNTLEEIDRLLEGVNL